MKRYLLFEADYYYPFGGWHDFVGAYDTIEEAEDASTKRSDMIQIIDTHHIGDPCDAWIIGE